nr:HTH domain-containing protein [Cytophagales bacterium]
MTSEKKIPNPTKALFIIVLFPEATAAQIGEILGVSSRAAETYIQKLKAEGILEREGGGYTASGVNLPIWQAGLAVLVLSTGNAIQAISSMSGTKS